MKCPECGNDLQVVEERSFVQRAWAWFNHGPPVWRREFECRACGFTGTDRSITSLSRSGAIARIVHRWRRFQFSRRVMPVPRFYVILGVAGAVVGAALNLTVGWSWWWTGLAMPLGGWLWAASSLRPGR